MIKLIKNLNEYIIYDDKTDLKINLHYKDAKNICRQLMVEFNIVEFYLNDQRAGHKLDQEFIELLKNKWGPLIWERLLK